MEEVALPGDGIEYQPGLLSLYILLAKCECEYHFCFIAMFFLMEKIT